MYSLVFPGQGSQSVGMAGDFCAQFPESRAVLAEADDALGQPLSRWIAEGPDDVLRPTAVQQPAILAAAIAMLRALQARVPLAPARVAGHSLGEYTALVAAGALPLADAVRLVHRRGQFMQEAVPAGVGAMSAILGLAGEDVARVCAELGSSAAPANFNSPVQTVIAGRAEDVEAAEKRLLEAGAKRAVRLEVSAPFHCALMQPAMEKLAPLLGAAPFSRGAWPIVSNVTAAPYQEAAEARELLRQQVCAPVRWIECVQQMAAGGSKLLLEVGPGQVLTGLTARIDRGLERANLAVVEDLAKVEAALAKVAA